MANLALNLFNREYTLEISRQGSTFHVIHDDKTAELTLIFQEDNTFILEWLLPNGTRKRIHAAGLIDGDKRQIWVDGQTVVYERIRERGRSAPLEGALASSIPAVVTQVLVAEGDHVSAGDKLILLESMKMIIPIQAPFDGQVTAIRCREGESVQAGFKLLDLAENP